MKRDLEELEEQLRLQVKKVTLMDGDQKQFLKQAEDTKQKNQDWLAKLKQQNRKLKNMRDELIRGKRQHTNESLSRTLTSFSSSNHNEVRNQAFYRRELDKQRHLTKTKKAILVNLQDKLKEVEDNKISYIEQSPMMRDIRILQNRLDKMMIKYNEAHSIRKSYQQIVKRLKMERTGYDNQLTAIQKSLKGKEHDFQELLLLAHDATHAKEQAQAELKKFQHKRTAIKDLRENYIQQKKEDIDNKRNNIMNQDHNQPYEQEQNNQLNQIEPNQNNELFQYQDAFRKLKQVTGVYDANQIILKFKTQGNTTKSLEDLRDNYRNKIQQLKAEKQSLKSKFDVCKYQQSSQSTLSDKIDRRKMDQLEDNTNKLLNDYQRWKVKLERIDKILVNVKAGVEHLERHLKLIQKLPENSKNPNQKNSSNLQQTLLKVNEALKKCYQTVKNDIGFRPDKFKQSTVAIQKYLLMEKNNRILKKEEQEMSDHQFDEQLTDQIPNKIKQKNLFHQQQLQQHQLSGNNTKQIRKLKRFAKPQF